MPTAEEYFWNHVAALMDQAQMELAAFALSVLSYVPYAALGVLVIVGLAVLALLLTSWKNARQRRAPAAPVAERTAPRLAEAPVWASAR